LYHYQSFRGDSIGYLEKTLSERTIHFSKPSGFNDPWDCKPWFDGALLDDANEREMHLRWIVATNRLTKDHPTVDELRNNPVLLRATIELIRDGVINAIDEQYRVYCLTPEPLSALMWSHYGDNHRGICLEFDASADQMIGAYRVHYQNHYPAVRIYDDEDNASLVPVFTKSDVWAYESEFRLIAEEGREQKRDMLGTNDSELRLQCGTLTGVVIGCQCDEDHVHELVGRYAPELRLRRARRDLGQYVLHLETIR
jgi:hypothetical protein